MLLFLFMKTKRYMLAPMGAASLLCGVRTARYSVQRDDSCGSQIKSCSKIVKSKFSTGVFYLRSNCLENSIVSFKKTLASCGFDWHKKKR